MKKVYLFLLLLLSFFISNTANAQLPQEIFPEFLPPPPGPPDACDMGGTYSIGPGGDYLSVTAALDTLKARGVSTDVILELNAAYSSNAETFPIVFPKDTEIPCYGGTFSLILRPAAGVANSVIRGSALGNSIIQLDSCSYVTIDGRAGGIGTEDILTIVNDESGPALDLYSAVNCRILYTRLSAAPPDIVGEDIQSCVVRVNGYVNGRGSNFNSIRYCKIYGPVTSPTVKPLLIYAGNFGAASVNRSDTIEHCEFFDFDRSAIFLDNSVDGWIIRSNSFYKTGNFDFYDNPTMMYIYSPGSDNQHIIQDNFFGGSAANCGGDPMIIRSFTGMNCINVYGQCHITGNKFARLSFVSTSSFGFYGNIVKVTSASNITPSVISNNVFGNVENSSDTIFCYNPFASSGNVFRVIETLLNTKCYMENNRFSGINAYSVDEGSIALEMIFSINGNPVIINNTIGGTVSGMGISNYTDAPSYGIYSLQGASVINENTISGIVGFSRGEFASVQGIVVNRGSIDSICRNRVFHLRNNVGPNNGYAPLAGISVSPDNPGGLANAIEGNHIYSLHNGASLQGGSVSGIFVRGNVFLRHNLIHSLNSSDAFSTSIYGILIPDKESVVENNMISLGLDSVGNSITAGNLSFYGIAGGNVLRHNSVYIGGSNVEDGFLGSACYLFIGSALNAEYHNNIFVNNRSNANAASATKHQCINIDLSYTGNNNIFYYNGQGGITGTYQNNRYNTLAQWQAGSGKDAASLFADPLFALPAAPASGVNLHLQYGSPADGAGGNSYTSTLDFDSEDRAFLTPVDIGADAGLYAACPVANAGPDYVVVEGGSLQLGGIASPGLSYVWTGPNGFTSTLSNPLISDITPLNAGIYGVTVSSGNCVSSDSMMLQVFPALDFVVCTGANNYLVADNPAAAIYQWQVNTGNGYVNISDNATYTGVNDDTLYFTNASSVLYGNKYRCVANGIAGMSYKIEFRNTWTGAVDNNWGNPANWSCNSVPDGNTDVFINNGNVLVNVNGTCRLLHVAFGVVITVATGFNLTITH